MPSAGRQASVSVKGSKTSERYYLALRESGGRGERGGGGKGGRGERGEGGKGEGGRGEKGGVEGWDGEISKR